MKKIKSITLAVLLACVQGYGTQPTDCEIAVRRGAGPTFLQNIETIRYMEDEDKESFTITPLKNNCEDSVKGYVGRLDVKKVNGNLNISISANNRESIYFLATEQLETLTKLSKLIFGSSELQIL